ncbi:MAG: RnfABCDGE type electron transport complex subunit D [Lentisphaerae bacterium]|nr:RnfABCDGE type electron transport complex subunit D [Lentisphaerota bacterium]
MSQQSIKWINWQQPMKHVLFACAPLMVASIYLFGWRVAVMGMLASAAAYATEAVFTRRWKEPVSSAVFVSAVLFTFSLPPTLPLWMAIVGIVFGILFGKMVYGGFGRNVFNPALTGRAFIYICFGNFMTAQWYEPWTRFPAGLIRWGYTAAGAPPDVITTATPGALMKLSTEALTAHGVTAADLSSSTLFLGDCSGVIGGTSAALTLLCGLYIIWKKAANYRIVLSGFFGFAAIQTVFWQLGLGNAADPLRAALGGSLVIGIFFYATDPVSASQTNPGRWIYGALIGALSSVIATFSAWPAGTMFAILLANMFAPILDHAIRSLQAKPAGGASGTGGPTKKR